MQKGNKLYNFIINIHLLPIVLTPCALWLISGIHKWSHIIDGSIWGPEKTAWIPWLEEHFKSISFINDPMIIALFFLLAVVQLGAGLAFVIGILKGEFILNRGKQWLTVGLILGMANVAILSLGQNLANDDTDVFQLTAYFGAHLFCLFYINYIDKDFFYKRPLRK